MNRCIGIVWPASGQALKLGIVQAEKHLIEQNTTGFVTRSLQHEEWGVCLAPFCDQGHQSSGRMIGRGGFGN